MAVAVQHNALNMLLIQAAKPCKQIGFGVANRTKNNEHNEQLQSVTVVFIALFLQLFVFNLYVVDVVKKRSADLPVLKDLLFDLFGK